VIENCRLPLLEKEMFLPLKNFALCRIVQVESRGFAVFWSEDIDLSEYEIWTHGKPINE